MSVFIAWSGCEDVQEWSWQNVEVSSMREILGILFENLFEYLLKKLFEKFV